MLTLHKKNRLSGAVTVPGDKSISHRAVMFGSLARGTTEITGFLNGADCLSTIDCFRRLGVDIETDRAAQGIVRVHGRGMRALSPRSGGAEVSLDTGNSGTTTRIISGILAPQPFTTILSGDASINRRPMKRVIEPLSLMGARIESVAGNGCAPLRITGSPLHAVSYVSPVASAQVKSAILCAGLYADAPTNVTEPTLSRDHTERMLTMFGAHVEITGKTGLVGSDHDTVRSDKSSVSAAFSAPAICLPAPATITVSPCDELHAQEIHVPGDISSAAYFIAAALLVPHSEVLIRNVGLNPTRAGILTVAESMGADITYLNRTDGAEPTADLLVRSSALHGTTVEGALIPTLIDELPVIAVMAAAAEGTTIIRDAAELRVKESDRISVVAENLSAMGADITPTQDGFVIRGGRPLHGALIRTHLDHRIAMSFAVASLIAGGETQIDEESCVSISYPRFFGDLEALSCEPDSKPEEDSAGTANIADGRRTSDYKFDLPQELIAQDPLSDRAASRLLVLDRESGKTQDRIFRDIIDYLSPGETLVLNNTRVIPARLLGTKPDTGAAVEILLLKRRENDIWETLVRPGKKLRPGAQVTFGDGSLTATVLEVVEEGNRLVQFHYEGIFEEVLDRLGEMPLPPYITHKLENPSMYQTVYAKYDGSAAAPTAGLHFTEELLQQIQEKGIHLAYVTLHVGLGTFRPVKVDDVTQHHMHTEWYQVTQETADLINRTHAQDKRVICVGTTSCRTIESAADETGLVHAGSGNTSIFIYPGYRFKAMDALITNFHLPESTLMMLVSAFAGRESILSAYREAIDKRYRFFSFGDAMYIS